jgi:hypothetical protein
MSTPRLWLGISNREWLINSNTPQFAITRSLPHGHVAAVAAMAHQLGLPALLGPRAGPVIWRWG